jgi:hypothetical protein
MKFLLAVLVAGIVSGTAYAFAATLGVSTHGLGAGSAPAAACGSGLALTYTTEFDAGISGYAVDGVEVSDIPAACLSRQLSVTFDDSRNIADGSAVDATLPASGTTESIPIAPSSNTIDAAQIGGVSVVIS